MLTTFKILMVVSRSMILMISHRNFLIVPSSPKTICYIVIPGMDGNDKCRDLEK